MRASLIARLWYIRVTAWTMNMILRIFQNQMKIHSYSHTKNVCQHSTEVNLYFNKMIQNSGWWCYSIAKLKSDWKMTCNLISMWLIRTMKLCLNYCTDNNLCNTAFQMINLKFNKNNRKNWIHFWKSLNIYKFTMKKKFTMNKLCIRDLKLECIALGKTVMKNMKHKGLILMMKNNGTIGLLVWRLISIIPLNYMIIMTCIIAEWGIMAMLSRLIITLEHIKWRIKHYNLL